MILQYLKINIYIKQQAIQYKIHILVIQKLGLKVKKYLQTGLKEDKKNYIGKKYK